MKIIHALEKYEKKPDEIAVFMAGGMGNTDWHKEFLETLSKFPLDNMVIYNPYNPEIKSAYEQIFWEFKYLNDYVEDQFIFSIYFDKFTDQPVSMYELGRALALAESKSISLEYGNSGINIPIVKGFPCVVSVNEDAPKKTDIIIQTGIAHQTASVRTPKEHAFAVIKEYNRMERRICRK